MKAFFSIAAIVVTFALFIPYVFSIRVGKIKPHVFSWVVWGLGTVIVFFAQLADGAGIGAWPIGISGVITFYIAFLAYVHRGDTVVTQRDWLFFLLALSALPFWFITANPLWAVLTLTFADLMGFGPTVRQAYNRPCNESVWFFALAALRNLLVIFALEHYSMTTSLFPAAIGVACMFLSLMLVYRRRSITE